MVVRIRVGSWGRTSALKASVAAVLRLAAAVCFVVGIWIIAAGLSWAGSFVVQQGLFSHWQVWVASGVTFLLAAFRLNRQLIS